MVVSPKKRSAKELKALEYAQESKLQMGACTHLTDSVPYSFDRDDHDIDTLLHVTFARNTKKFSGIGYWHPEWYATGQCSGKFAAHLYSVKSDVLFAALPGPNKREWKTKDSPGGYEDLGSPSDYVVLHVRQLWPRPSLT